MHNRQGDIALFSFSFVQDDFYFQLHCTLRHRFTRTDGNYIRMGIRGMERLGLSLPIRRRFFLFCFGVIIGEDLRLGGNLRFYFLFATIATDVLKFYSLKLCITVFEHR